MHTIRLRKQARNLKSSSAVRTETQSPLMNTIHLCHGLHFLLGTAGRSPCLGCLMCLVSALYSSIIYSLYIHVHVHVTCICGHEKERYQPGFRCCVRVCIYLHVHVHVAML